MTVRIGVIGNSHLAAFKLGWEQCKDEYPQVDMIFYGSPATSMRQLKVSDGRIVPTSDVVRENFIWTSGGYDHIHGDLDAYILVGMGFSFIHLVALLQRHRLPEQYDPLNDNHQLISDEFLKAAMRATLENSNARMVVRMMKQISHSPLVYAPNPYGTDEVMTDPEFDYYWNDIIRLRLFDFYRTALQEFNQEECEVAIQPEATITKTMFTKVEYSRGSIKLKKGMSSRHEANDYFHMNGDFGAASIREILANHLQATVRL